MNLRSRVAFILVGLSVVVIVPIALAMLHAMGRSPREATGGRLDDLARTNAASVARFLEGGLGETRQVALSLAPAALASRDAVAAETLGKPVGNSPRCQNGCFVLDREGVLWADYPAVAGTRGRTFVWREYFRRTVAEGRGVVSEPYRSARTAEPVVTFTAPLSDRDGRPDGLVGRSVQLGHPEALGGFLQARIGETGYLYVIDRSRLMVVHPERARLLVRDTAPGANRLLDRALAGFEGWGETLNSRGVPMLLALRSVGGTNWVLGAQQTQAEAYGPIRAARASIVVGTAGAALRTLRESEERFRLAFFTSPDAININRLRAGEDPPRALQLPILARGRDEAILVVDDEEVIRSLSVEMLGMSGYRPSAAPGGEEALRLLAAPDFHCDLVILDLGMPGIGGLACLRAIRELRPGLPVVVATGYTAEGVAEELRAAGAAAVLGKPLRVAELLAAARGAIDGRPSGG